METLRKIMNGAKSFLEALLGDDERLVMKKFAKNGELFPGAAPTVQKVLWLANKDALVAEAKKMEAKKKATGSNT